MAKPKVRGNGEGTIYKRKSDGKYVGAITLPSGKRQVFYGKTARAVRNKIDEAKGNLRQGRRATPEQQKVGEFLAQWLEAERWGTVYRNARTISPFLPAGDDRASETTRKLPRASAYLLRPLGSRLSPSRRCPI